MCRYDEATQLKNRVNCQREKIKRIVKLMRATNRQKKMFKAQDCCCIHEGVADDQSERTKELESTNKKLLKKLNTLKMHLLCSRKQLTVYGRRHPQSMSIPLSSRSSNHTVHLGEVKTANDRMVCILEERIDALTKELNTIKSHSEQRTKKLEQQLAKLQTKVKNEKFQKTIQKTLKLKPKHILDKNIQAGSEYLGNSDLLIEQLFAERKRVKDLEKQLEDHLQGANEKSKEVPVPIKTDHDAEKPYDVVKGNMERETIVTNTREKVNDHQRICNGNVNHYNDEFESYKDKIKEFSLKPLGSMNLLSPELNTFELNATLSDKRIINDLLIMSDYRRNENAEVQAETNSHHEQSTATKDLEIAQRKKRIFDDMAVEMQPLCRHLKCKICPQRNISNGKRRYDEFTKSKAWQAKRPRSQDSGRRRFITMGLQGSSDQRYKNSLNHVQTKVEYQPLSRPKTPVHDCLKIQPIPLVANKPAICKNEQSLITEKCNKQINRGTKDHSNKTVDGFTMTESYKQILQPTSTRSYQSMMTPNDVKQTLDSIMRDLCTCKKMLRHQKASNLQRRNISSSAKVKLYDQKTDDAFNDKNIKPKSKKTNTKPVRKVIPNKRVPNSRRVANSEVHKSKPHYDNAISCIKKPLLSTKETKQKTTHHKKKFRSVINGDGLLDSLFILLPSKISKMQRQSEIILDHNIKEHKTKTIEDHYDTDFSKKQRQSNFNKTKWIHAKEFQTENLDRQYDPNTKNIPIDSTEEFYLASVSNTRINILYNNVKLDVEDEKLKNDTEGLADIEQKESEILLKEEQIKSDIFTDELLDHMQSGSNLEQKQTLTQTSSVMPYNTNGKSLKNNRVVNDFPITEHDFYPGNTQPFQFMRKDSALRNTRKSKCDKDISVSKNTMTPVCDLSIIVPSKAFLTIHFGKLQLSSDAEKLTKNSNIFLNWQFYTTEIRDTPIIMDQHISYDYTTNYNITLLPKLVQYLKNNKVCIEVHYTVDNHSEMFGMSMKTQVIENPNIWMSFELDVDSVPTTISTSRANIISNYDHLEVDCILNITFESIPKLMSFCLTSPKNVDMPDDRQNKVCIEVHCTVDNHSEMFGMSLKTQVIENPNIWMPFESDVDSVLTTISTSRANIISNYDHLEDAVGSNNLYKNNNSYVPTRKNNDSTKSQKKFSLCEDTNPTSCVAVSSEKRRSTDGMKKRLSFEADDLRPQSEPERRTSIGRKSFLRTIHSKSASSTTSTDGNQSIAITIRWLKLLPNLIQFSRELLTEIFIDYSFLSHFGEELETPNSLIRPTMADEKLDYNFRKVFNVDLNINPMDRTLLILLLEGVKTKSEIEFYAVSEPLEDPLDIETAEDFGKAVLSINDMLIDNPLEDSCVVLLPLTTLNGENRIGSLSVGVEGLDVMRDLKP